MISFCPDFVNAHRFSRRRLLEAGTAGVVGLCLPSLLKADQKPGTLRVPSTSSSCTSLAVRRIWIRLT